MSADSTSIARGRCVSRPFKAWMNKVEKKKDKQKAAAVKKNLDGGKGTNSYSGARHRIFGGGLRSMGSARVGYPMHFVDGTLRRSGLDR